MSWHDDKENIREDAEAISGSSEDRGHSLSNDVHPETGKSEEGGGRHEIGAPRRGTRPGG